MITNRKELKLYLTEDLKSLGFKQNFLHFIFPNPIVSYQRVLRHLEYYTNCRNIINYPIWLYYKYKFRHQSIRLGFSIPINVIGPGLSIAHYGTIVISQYAKIGKNCRIHACVNIGASAGNDKAPKIGDNVYIGPGALLFGDINIADNTTIAANATVNHSIDEPNKVLAGVPAHIVKNNYPDWTIFNKREK